MCIRDRVWRERVEEYLGALEKEMDFVQEAFRDKVLDSVYTVSYTHLSGKGSDVP